jgi:hypothetical protein
MIRLTEPGLGLAKRMQGESAVKYITGGETESRPFRTDHHATEIKS